MLRIVHLSDIHLEKNNMDLETVVTSLCNQLKEYNDKRQIDIIIFSGDLIDKGAESFNKNFKEAYSFFEKLVINKISSNINISRNRFFFVPGNHDVDRNADDKIDEEGLKAILVDSKSVNEHIDKGKTKGIQRILPFKEFEREYYRSYDNNKDLSNYQSTFMVKVNNLTIGVNCFNSVWRSYSSEEDIKNLLLGERQISSARKSINTCDIKIAVIHHPLDVFREFERDFINKNIEKDYDLLCCGHAHKGSNWTQTSSMLGSLLVSCAPSNWAYNMRSDSRKTSNGYSIIDYDKPNRKTKITNLRYLNDSQKFVLNTDLGDNGISSFTLPSTGEITSEQEEISIASNIKDLHFEELNEHLLSYSTDTGAPKDIDSLFVLPYIVSKVEYDIEKQKEEKTYNLDDICRINDNVIIFGTKESGKTVFLDELVIQFTNNIRIYKKIPVRLDFTEFGGRRIETLISRYIKVGIRDMDIFIKNHKIVLLIDNISFSNLYIHQLSGLEKFVTNNPNVNIIATCNQIIEGEPPIELFDFPAFAKFKHKIIKKFRTKQIRELIDKWFSKNEDYDTPNKLEKIVKIFLTLNIPSNPLTISMFLWIFEKKPNYKPLNHAAMLENFVERLFEKTSAKEVYSEEFDYTNKLRLLTDIARYIFDNKKYRLPCDELISFITDNLKRKKFEFVGELILDYFLSTGILIKEEYENKIVIKFRFSCFFQYFLMKEMDYDPEFKKYVLKNDNLLKFPNEIDYYTGLKRDQADILKLLISKMNKEYEEINSIINKMQNTYDDIFSIDKSITSRLNETFIKKLESTEKPADKELDKTKDKMLEAINPVKDIELREEITPREKMERLWTISARVLKNTEWIEDSDLKKNAYKCILKCSMAYSNLYKYFLEKYLGEIKNVENIDEDIKIIRKLLPLIHQEVLFDLMGTGKLSLVIQEKIDEDKVEHKISDFERFISIFLFADIRKDSSVAIKNVKDFIKTIRKKYIYDMVFFKLMYYFFLSKNKQKDIIYENLIGETIVRSKKLAKKEKGVIIQYYRSIRRKRRVEEKNK